MLETCSVESVFQGRIDPKAQAASGNSLEAWCPAAHDCRCMPHVACHCHGRFLVPERAYTWLPNQFNVVVVVGQPAVLTATPAAGNILAESYFGCVPIPRLVMSLADVVGNPTPARKVSFSARVFTCTRRPLGTLFRECSVYLGDLHSGAPRISSAVFKL